MSQNQTRVDKIDSQLRRSGRSGNQRGYSGGRGGGGGGAQPPPATRSSKKSGNVQLQVPKAPASQSSQSVGEDASRAAGSLQFGTINLGVVNGMQIPARTSSAPPNLDEQKHAQARQDSSRATPLIPMPFAPKQQQQQTRKDATGPNTGQSHPPVQAKRDGHVPVSSAPSGAPPKPSFPLGGMPMHMPFQQPQVPIQFAGPNSQIQPQVVPSNSIQMTMASPLVNGPQVPQQMYVPSLQSHPLQPQNMLHQSHGLGFAPQITHQVPPQIGNMGYGIAPQFSQPQVKYGGQRKTTVKITHPETHEELRLDKRTDPHMDIGASPQRPLANILPHSSQSIPTFSSSPQVNYYPPMQPNSYNPLPTFYHTSNSQMNLGSQDPRYSYSVGQNGQPIFFMHPSIHNPISDNKPQAFSETGNLESLSVSALSAPVQVTIRRPAVSSVVEKTGIQSVTNSKQNSESDTPLLKLQEDTSASHQEKDVEIVRHRELVELSVVDSQYSGTRSEGSNLQPIQGSDLVKESDDKTSKREQYQLQNQTDVSDGADMTKVTSEIITDRPDIISPGALETLEKIQSNSESDSSTSTTRLSSLTPTESKTSVAIEAKAVPTVSSSSGVPLEIEESVNSSGESATNSSSARERGSLETLTSLGPKVQEELACREHGNAEVSAELLQDNDSTQSYTVPSLTESLRVGVPSRLEETRIENPKELVSLELKLGEKEQSQTSEEAVHCEANVESSDIAEVKPLDADTVRNNSEIPSVSPEGERKRLSGEKEKTMSEPARTKPNAVKKKKMKEILSKADAAGTSDLYNAYKGPEEKGQEDIPNTSDAADGSLTVDVKQVEDTDEHKKDEIDDWEDAAEISTPNLKTLANGQHDHGSDATSKKRYTRDFLLTFSEQCTDLPLGFEIGSDITDLLMITPVGSSPSPGRITNRSPGASRDNKWTKVAGTLGTMRDIQMDMGYGAPNIGFLPGQGVNYAALRNSRAQSFNHFTSGILPGPMQGGIPKNNADADRWQRATGVQRGLIPSPHAPSQVMHKATRKYEVGKVSDAEEAKQRQLKAILNKLTPQNFEKLFLQVKEVNIDNTVTLTGVISQIFDKALMEPTFCEMYANFCVHLSNELPDFSEDNEKITFKRLLLNKCQEEFERGEREQAEANRVEEEGEIKQTEGQREEKRIQARRRMLGNIRLIGELYKKRMLTERIMHECIKKLLGEYQNPDEEDLEALCKLMSTIGEMIDHPRAKEFMDSYFDGMLKLSTNQKLSSRVRFMLRDAIDLRKNNWQQRRKVEGPKKIDQVHRDAAQERQAQSNRLARGPVITSAPRRGHVDYSPRGSPVLSSPSSQQIGGTRGFSTQVRGYAVQDVRMDDRHHHFESRVLSVPLPQRAIDDASITLGPQGGLAKGMSIRGQPMMSNLPSAGPAGYNSTSEENMTRNMQDKFSGATYNQRSPQNRNNSFGGRDARVADRVIDRSTVITPPGRIHGSSRGILQEPFESRTLSEAALREKSISAIREFYSAKDEEEVALCIKELNSPSFYPSMISLWVMDSFERKETDRNLLAGLLITLFKSQDKLFNESQLIQGFETVLSSLEDAVNDAPRATEFLGQMLAKISIEDILPLSEIEKLIYEGGEEPGSLRETGLASEVLGSILEFITTEKGDSVMSEMRRSCNLRLEDFLPPHPTKTNKLHAFL